MMRAERVLFAVAVVALGWYAAAQANTMLYQAAQSRELDALRLERADVRLPPPDVPRPPDDPRPPDVRPPADVPPSPDARRAAAPSPPALSSRDVPPAPAARGLVGKIEIPRLGVSAIVRRGVDDRTLRRAVGHVPDTALPGQEGNVALAGHRDTFFRPLKHARVGDVIHMRTPDGDFTYVVRETRIVGPAEMSVLEPTPEATLTLITCYPFYYVGDAPDRFIVRAQLIDAAPVSGR